MRQRHTKKRVSFSLSSFFLHNYNLTRAFPQPKDRFGNFPHQIISIRGFKTVRLSMFVLIAQVLTCFSAITCPATRDKYPALKNTAGQRLATPVCAASDLKTSPACPINREGITARAAPAVLPVIRAPASAPCGSPDSRHCS
jgi:hypothetical protein